MYCCNEQCTFSITEACNNAHSLPPSRFCGTGDYCWIHHGRTLSLTLEPGADPSKEVNKMCRSHGKSRANTDRIFKRGSPHQQFLIFFYGWDTVNMFFHV